MEIGDKKSNNDSFDINELAYLDEDITTEFIEKLQRDAEAQAKQLENNVEELDVNMFEDIQQPLRQVENVVNKSAEPVESQAELVQQEIAIEPTTISDGVDETVTDIGEITNNNDKTNNTVVHDNKEVGINTGVDDNFIKKYRAKLSKQMQGAEDEDATLQDSSKQGGNSATNSDGQSIEELSKGMITERDITQQQQEYNESLNYDDDNIKYSKYIIYVAPENTEFINSLTIKERKNLINKILSEQGILVLSKKRADYIKSVLKHLLLTIVTIAIMLPIIYKIFNISLETTIDNYHRSQNNFQTLYREKGKIKPLR